MSWVHFNEAAGIPRGRLSDLEQRLASLSTSMRPRVFPADDHRVGRVAPRGRLTSMRPRVFPADDVSGT